MPGFSSVDDMVLEMTTNKKYTRAVGQRIINTGATSVAGRWHECFAVSTAGTGGAGVITGGTAGRGYAFDSSSAGAIPINPAAVSSDLRYLTTMMASTAIATAVPLTVMLTDILYVYQANVVTGTASTIDNGTNAKPTRFTLDSVAGKGVQCSAVVAGTAIGAATPLLTVTYTDCVNGGSRTGTVIASAASLPIGSLFSGGNQAVLGSPFMQLQAGDTGVASIQSYAITSGGTTGTVAFVLHRPIATVPVIAINTPGERDMLFQFPSMPQIQDSACLTFLALIGGATVVNSPIYYELGMAWG